MALDESAMTDLLAALRAGGGLDVVREALGLVLQALIDAEATQQIGADRYQRSASRTTHRNGSRARLLSTNAGDVELHIPKLREGSFFPAMLEPRPGSAAVSSRDRRATPASVRCPWPRWWWKRFAASFPPAATPRLSCSPARVAARQ